MDVTSLSVERSADRQKFVAYLADRCEAVERMCATSGTSLSLIVDGTIASEVLFRISRDASRIGGPNLIKKNALLTFWVRKLKPIKVDGDSNSPWQRYANELVAFIGGIDSLNEIRRVSFTPRYISEIIYDLRFRAWSPYSITLLYETIWGYDKKAEKHHITY